MLDFILSIFRYLFLLLLYFFIFQLIKLMLRDLHGFSSRESRYQHEILEKTSENVNFSKEDNNAALLVQSSDDSGIIQGSVFYLNSGKSISIGRGTHNSIVLTDPFSSLDHCRVYEQDGQYRLMDNGSKNGTFLNNVRIDKPILLTDGDIIRIGSVNLQFVRWAYEMEPGN
ncbi:MAG: FHA domain-containing protein [Peptococcaceae bacterium]|nr:FHA domain-containing protein [Peptococcaceae bacterium]